LNGTFTSPGNPGDYPNNAYCKWDISVPSGYHIVLDFALVNIQKSDDCKKDFLKVCAETNRILEAYFYFVILFLLISAKRLT
jgi:hypothetical protein